MMSLWNKIPRVVYYMDPSEPVRSLFKWFIGKGKKGSSVFNFEKELSNYLEIKNLHCLSHARICLYFALKSFPFEKGDEVLMTPINLPDMVNMIRILGLQERFVDIKSEDYSIDLEEAKKKLNSKSKYLFVTHLNGFVPNMDDIVEFARENNLILIQDTTQNFGAKYNGTPLEEFGELAFFSLCDLKVLHTHMGGVLCGKDPRTLEKAVEVSKKELSPLSFSYLKKFLVEDLIATLILNRLLFNLFIYPVLKLITFSVGSQNIQDLTNGKGVRFGTVVLLKGLFGGGGDVLTKAVPKKMLYEYSDLQAEIGLRRLQNLRLIDERRKSYSRYFESHLKIPEENKISGTQKGNVYWKFPVLVEDWERLQKYLMSFGIDSARSNLPCLSELNYLNSSDKTPNASRLVRNSLYIPAHYYLNEDEVEQIVEVMNSYWGPA